MELTYSLRIMMIFSFIIQFIVMSIIMTNSIYNITFSLGKLYISVVMALLMGLAEIAMFDIQMRTFNIEYYLILLFTLVIFIYLYRNQSYIDDTEYLKEMIEHHSMALLTSDAIQQKPDISVRVQKLAENIALAQEKEIEFMKQITQ